MSANNVKIIPTVIGPIIGMMSTTPAKKPKSIGYLMSRAKQRILVETPTISIIKNFTPNQRAIFAFDFAQMFM